jgi:hypothetical protein
MIRLARHLAYSFANNVTSLRRPLAEADPEVHRIILA